MPGRSSDLICYTERLAGGRPHRVDGDLDRVHGGVTDFVVRSIHQDLIKDLVEPRDERNRLELHLDTIVHPEWLLLLLCAADVCVWTQQDVLQLGLFLVNVLDRLASCPGGCLGGLGTLSFHKV